MAVLSSKMMDYPLQVSFFSLSFSSQRVSYITDYTHTYFSFSFYCSWRLASCSIVLTRCHYCLCPYSSPPILLSQRLRVCCLMSGPFTYSLAFLDAAPCLFPHLKGVLLPFVLRPCSSPCLVLAFLSSLSFPFLAKHFTLSKWSPRRVPLTCPSSSDSHTAGSSTPSPKLTQETPFHVNYWQAGYVLFWPPLKTWSVDFFGSGSNLKALHSQVVLVRNSTTPQGNRTLSMPARCRPLSLKVRRKGRCCECRERQRVYGLKDAAKQGPLGDESVWRRKSNISKIYVQYQAQKVRSEMANKNQMLLSFICD